MSEDMKNNRVTLRFDADARLTIGVNDMVSRCSLRLEPFQVRKLINMLERMESGEVTL